MYKQPSIIKNAVLSVLIAVLVLVVFPTTNVLAAGLNDTGEPPIGTIRLTDERLERLWAHMQRVYERQGYRLERADTVSDRVQILIDRLEENGKDVMALQAALDTFNEALKEAHPIHESAKGIINSHQGFDAEGKVTDHEKAVETVRALGEKLREVHQIVGEPGRALRDALHAFRDAHPRADNSGS